MTDALHSGPLIRFVCNDLIPCGAVCFIPMEEMHRYPVDEWKGPYCPACDGHMKREEPS